MDAYPMLVACWKGQQPEGGSDLIGPNCCLNCGELTHFMHRFCSLCKIKEELKLVTLVYPGIKIYAG